MLAFTRSDWASAVIDSLPLPGSLIIGGVLGALWQHQPLFTPFRVFFVGGFALFFLAFSTALRLYVLRRNRARRIRFFSHHSGIASFSKPPPD